MQKTNPVFQGCSMSYDRARLVLFGAPFDTACGPRIGGSFAPAAMRHASHKMESYSFYQKKDLFDCPVCDLGDMDASVVRGTELLEAVETETRRLAGDGKIPLLLGSSPMTSLGSVRALYQKYPRLHVVQFGAHARLKDQYDGKELHSLCIMRRCYELLGENRIHQFCIRSGSREEVQFASAHTDIHPLGFEWLQPTMDQTRLRQNPIYFTLNLDCLDPSVFSASEQPILNGVSFLQLLEAIRIVCRGWIVGADVTGLLPASDSDGTSARVASQVIRELILSMLRT